MSKSNYVSQIVPAIHKFEYLGENACAGCGQIALPDGLDLEMLRCCDVVVYKTPPQDGVSEEVVNLLGETPTQMLRPTMRYEIPDHCLSIGRTNEGLINSIELADAANGEEFATFFLQDFYDMAGVPEHPRRNIECVIAFDPDQYPFPVIFFAP
ncbi:MAG: hypothetical protein ACOX0Z_03330 [Candidatus Nanosyncoccaceae bacterium]|jgi:hypothetical protein